MSIDWTKYKSALKRAYFGDHGVLQRDTPAADDFWAFFTKYQDFAQRKGINVDRALAEEGRSVPRASSLLNSLGLPSHGRYSKYHKQWIDFRIGKTERYTLERECPKHVVVEFEYIVHCYVEFLQRERMGKLQKLRATQKSLPIFTHKEAILDAVANNQVVIVAGDTGCGKSTQLPQYLLGAKYAKIACTQPRRIACISLAKRVAFETLNEYGSQIAYAIRFEKTRTASTRILFLTEGLLLRQLNADPSLAAYDVIILDEVHERHLHGDFLLGILKALCENARVGNLKLILMSATINIELFSSYFGGKAPVICVPGRLYPIKLHYRPPPPKDRDLSKSSKSSEKIDAGPYLRILQTIESSYTTSERGDVLVFLSGLKEIETIAEAVTEFAKESRRWIVLMLHSTLSIDEQDRVFDIAPEGVRKVILSTNIAETSVTIDGVRFVVDSGKVKEMRYDSSTRMHRLQEINVSKASAEQRKGRAGRTGPGVCFRLYSPDEFEKFDAYSTSEIHRVSLESLVLQMFHLGLMRQGGAFMFVEAPASEKIEEAIESLRDQAAVTVGGEKQAEGAVGGEKQAVEGAVGGEKKAEGAVGGEKQAEGAVAEEPKVSTAEEEHDETGEHLTALGKILVNLPVDVAIGKMLVMGCMFRQVEAILTVSAALSVQSPYTSRSYRDLDMLRARRDLLSDHGDAFALLKTYRAWLELKQQPGGESTKRWCVRRGVEEQRLYELTKLRNQFKELLESCELIEKRSFDENASAVDRRLRHGELKRLKDLKRTMQHSQRKRKVLKADGVDFVAEDEAGGEASTPDANALEFYMKHTNAEMQSRTDEMRLSVSTLTLVKFVLAAGLYPQYGILDQFNSYRPGQDTMMHTRTKPFVVLHPNSGLGQEPDSLQIHPDAEGGSTSHQLVFYGMLLETTKPYAVNSLRVQALHTLMLVARSIDTNRDCTAVAFDRWVEVRTSNALLMQTLLFEAVEIRRLLGESLKRKLAGDAFRSDRLSTRIVEFFTQMATQLVYKLKRLMRADQNTMFVGAASNVELPDELRDHFDAIPNVEKGGFDLTEFLTFGSLVDAAESGAETEHYLTLNWTCPVCEERLFVTAIERVRHLREHTAADEARESSGKSAVGVRIVPRQPANKPDEESPQETAGPSTSGEGARPGTRSYFCQECDAEIIGTIADILRHKKSH